MGSLHVPDGWLAADPSDPTTDMESTWWTSKIDIDREVFYSGDASIIFKPATSGSVYLIRKDPYVVTPGQRLLANARFMNDDMDIAESLFVVGVAFYDEDDAYIDIAKSDSYALASDAAIAAATEDRWMNLSAHANVNDFSGAVYARTVIGRSSTSGDTNTIWCDEADVILEPPFQSMTRVTSDSFGGGGVNDVFFTAAAINADGFFIDSVGRAICLVGGTYVVTGTLETTLTDGNSSMAVLQKGTWTGASLSIAIFSRGTELHHRTGNLALFSHVSGIERFRPGDMVILGTQTTGAGSLNTAKVSAVRIGA